MGINRRRFLQALAAAGVVRGLNNGTWAAPQEEYPRKQITMLVAFAAGGKMDAEARTLAVYVKKHLQVNVLIENVPGANGRIGLTKLWNSKPDGYTIGGVTLPNILLVETMTKAEFRSKEFTKIFAWGQTNQGLAVRTDTWNTLEEFVKAAKARPLSCGISGIGGTSHLAGLVLEEAFGVKFNWVPFDSGAEAVTALAGKHIDAAMVASTTAVPLQRAGRIKVLVMSAWERDKTMPDVPIPKEFGYHYTPVPSINGVAGPPGLDVEKVRILEAAFAKAAKEPEFVEWAQRTATPLVSLTGKEFSQATEEMAKEVEKYKHLLGS